jgi:hypothetical protein
VRGNSHSKRLPVARHESTSHRWFHMAYILAFCVVSAITGNRAAESQGPPPPRTNGDIHNVLSKLCLQPENASTQLGAAIVQMPCDNSSAQHWKSVPAPKGGWSHYVNQLSGLCLDARGGAANYTPIQQWTCNNITNEYWSYGQSIGATEPILISGVANTGYADPLFCLDMPGALPTAGAKMWLFKCNQTIAQSFLGP